MNNEILLILSVFIYLGSFIALFKVFGKTGIFLWVILSTLFANIEVLININAFGFNMSLGNVLFASTFLATDVLSERYGKKSASTAAYLGVTTTCLYLLFSQFWLSFSPSDQDFVSPHMNVIFDNSFRIGFVSVMVYFISQKHDIYIYHLIWKFTERKTQNKRSYLWLRNNLSTLTTQFINNLLFAFFAFAPINLGFINLPGLFDIPTVISIFITGYIIMAILALIDTPLCYVCRDLEVTERN